MLAFCYLLAMAFINPFRLAGISGVVAAASGLGLAPINLIVFEMSRVRDEMRSCIFN
jgi:hypothetical protein